MTNDFVEFLPDIQSINHENNTGFVVFCGSNQIAGSIRQQLLDDFNIYSVTDYDNNDFYYVIPLSPIDDKTMSNFIRRGWNYDRDQQFVQYLITFYNADAANKMYNMLIARGYTVNMLQNNMQLQIRCLADSLCNTEIQNMASNLTAMQKSCIMSVDDYFNKILFSGKIENIEYRNIRKQEFEFDEIEQNKDIIVRGVLYQYFNKRIRSYLSQQTFPKKFDANKLDEKEKQNINLIRDFLYAKATDYVNMQITNAAQTKHSIIIRFDYLKSCNQYNSFRTTLRLARQWYKQEQNLAKNR